MLPTPPEIRSGHDPRLNPAMLDLPPPPSSPRLWGFHFVTYLSRIIALDPIPYHSLQKLGHLHLIYLTSLQPSILRFST